MTTRLSVGERTGRPVAEPRPQRWSRLWANLWTKRSGISEEGRDPLALHHAETTRRAREAMIEIVRAGYQIGPPPYGYRALRIRVTDPSGRNKLRAVLVPDWQTAAVVKQIFVWRADDGLTFAAVAARLNADLRQYPVLSGRWTAKAVRRIVTNVKYTGRQVWARTVAGSPAPVEHWVISAPMVHEPLVDERVFRRAQHGAGEELRCA
ncbi:recombinase family protein [Amycolatopsis plumensis]|uniref:Recombinase family protein n=1 Tax=Amycolatopsis plumensis TaxID=236508 RepID=A0ABV5U809_9PSEU